MLTFLERRVYQAHKVFLIPGKSVDFFHPLCLIARDYEFDNILIKKGFFRL